MEIRERATRPQAALPQAPTAGGQATAPLTSATVAAFTVGVAATAAAGLGIAAVETAAAGFLALVLGLVLAVPTVATGFLGYLAVPRGSATAQWPIMAAAVLLFLVAAALLDDGYRSGDVPLAGVGVAACAELVLVLGLALPVLGARGGLTRPPR